MSAIDVLSPDIYLTGVPHETFRKLRAESPVFWHDEPGGRGFWGITKYADLMRISRDPGTFSSARGATFVTDPPPDDLSILQMIMLNMDPPQHVRFRNLVKYAFLPAVVRSLEPKIRTCVREIVDAVAERGECDFVEDVAAQMPLRVICDMLGVPASDRKYIYDLSNRLVGFDDPSLQQSKEDGTAAAAEMWQYAGQIAQERMDNPTDDIVSTLVKNVENGGLQSAEFASFFMLLVVAGNETTRNLTAGGMLALLEHPDQKRRLLEHPELLESGVEEMLRWVSPLIYFRRTATRDVELRGVKIKENDKVVMYYPSANRDEEVFENPYTFDVGRTPNDHLAFGTGQHMCLGANLARLEIRIMFEELLSRLPDLQLAGPVRRMRSNFVNAFMSIPVRYTPERRMARVSL